MRNLLSTLLTVVLLATLVAACDSFVEDVDLPIDSIDDDQLTTEGQVPFLIAGVETRFATTHDRLAAYSDGLSDQFIFDQRVPNATFPSFREIDEGDITFANNSVDGVYNDLGEVRFFADNLLERIAEIEFSDAELKRQAEFTGHFFGGVARYFYATYIALTPRDGGGVINAGPFIPAPQMYDLALEKLNAALGVGTEAQRRAVNTLIARIHLYKGEFDAARTAALNGLQEGDAPFQSRHSVESVNEYWIAAGPGRTQWVCDFRYKALVDADPAEAVRVPLTAITGNDSPPTTFYRQGKYNDRDTPLDFLTWQEGALIVAEVDLRGGDAAGALGRVNQVRASHGLPALAALDMDTLAFEREKEFFASGMRLADQRRFDRWHLGPNTWQFLPITQSERNQNENL